MAVQLILKNENLVKANCRVETIIGDDDSSAIAALRRLSPCAIEKWCDFNHAKKTFDSKLYDIKLSANLREYFSKVFSISIKQNKGDKVKVKIALVNIVPHAFGIHDHFGSFCTKCNDGTHAYKYFKDGRCLSDSILKQKLDKIIQPFINAPDPVHPAKAMNPSIIQFAPSI